MTTQIQQGWQVSANVIFYVNIIKKLVWSVQQNLSFAVVCSVETLLLMIINSYTGNV